MRPLFIDNTIREKIRAVIKYGMEHPIRDGEIAGDNPERVVEIEYGFRCVFSIESTEIEGKQQLARHLSVSVDEDGKIPEVLSVELLMKEFKFENDLENSYISILPYGNTRHAVYVAEPYNENLYGKGL